MKAGSDSNHRAVSSLHTGQRSNSESLCERNLLEAGIGAQRGTNSLLKPVSKPPTQIRETLTMKGQWHRLTRAEASEGGLETIRSVSCIYICKSMSVPKGQGNEDISISPPRTAQGKAACLYLSVLKS